MTRPSRPYLIALVAIGLLAAVWLIALRGHSGTSGSGASTSTPQPAAPATNSASSSPYTGSAPGVAGLTHAIEKARGAVALSEANAKQLQAKSAQASSPTSAGVQDDSAADAAAQGGTSVRASVLSTTRSASVQGHAHTVTAHTVSVSRHGSAASARAVAAPATQRTVEAELEHGHVVAILFWNPHATVDQLVRGELQTVAGAMHGRLTVHVARASQVGAFGSFTRAVQVYGTPTILIVNRHGQTTSLTGLTDAYSLQQAIAEAAH
jgi:hypothetical protein